MRGRLLVLTVLVALAGAAPAQAYKLGGKDWPGTITYHVGIPQYADAIAEAARILGPGGRLLVVDFAPHDREELRERDAHARLGFADDAMLGWMSAAGLDGEVVEHLRGGELTVTLWRGTKPGASLLQTKRLLQAKAA